MPKRDPHAVLGLEPGATQAEIKAAWRRLARRHHPDLTGNDQAAARAATARMAEINAAYESLRAGATRARTGAGRTGTGRSGAGERAEDSPRRPSGPPRARPQRPVTARLDTSQTFRPRNQTITGDGRPRRFDAHRSAFDGQPPLRSSGQDREPPRASDPTGPLRRGRIRSFRPPPLPPLEDARAHVVDFGRFRGHTLGEIGDFEPSYVDWVVRTITKDPDLVAAARVVQADLDRRGVPRRPRPAAEARRATDRTA